MTSDACGGGRTALIRRSGNLIHVFPPEQELLAPHLTYKKREQKSGNYKEAEYVTVEMWEVVDGGLLTPAGFTARVSTLLRENGYNIRYEDYREKTLPDPDFTRLDRLRDGQDEILVAIVSHDCGVIQAPTGSGKSFIIRQICKIWPLARIIIACPYTDVLKQTYAELCEIISSQEIGFVGAGKSDRSKRVVCCVTNSLMRCELDKCDIFIFDEVHRAAAPKTAEAIARIRTARMYGFSASPYGRSDNADLATEAIFGKSICILSYQEVQKKGSIVPVQVRLYDTAHIDSMMASTTTALERRGLWRNQKRNMLIVSAVQDLLSEFEDPQILISVKTTEHAVFLGHLLPDFKLCYANMGLKKREMWEAWKLIKAGEHPITAKQREEMRDNFKTGTLRKVIATGIWSTGVDFPGLNVIIRADGQAGQIQNTQIPGRVTRRDGEKRVGIVVDFNDLFNPTLLARAKKRLTEYRKKGWKIEIVATPYQSQ